MENKLPILAALSLIIFILSLHNLTNNKATAQRTPISIRSGVVLDVDSDEGRMGLNGISMALSDFCAPHEYYKTRKVLYNRDPNNYVAGAAEAAQHLPKNVEVRAIPGPLSADQANFMIRLGDKAQVHVITFSATSPSLSSIRSPCFIRAALSDSSQVNATSTTVQDFGRKEAVFIYVDSQFGEGFIPSPTDALEQKNDHIPYRGIIPPSATDDQIPEGLYKFMTMQTRGFVVTRAEQLGMTSGEQYAWIAKDSITNELNSMDPSVIESMLGVIGVKPYIAKMKELDNFKFRYRQKLQQNNTTALSLDLDIFGLWAYDSVTVLALAEEEARTRNSTFLESNTSKRSMDFEGFRVSASETELAQALSSTKFSGPTGKFNIIGGQPRSPPYEIVNAVDPADRILGYWTKENGVVREINHRNCKTITSSMSKSHGESIMWTADNASPPPKGPVIPTSRQKLRLGIPVQDSYSDFVHVTWDTNNLTEVRGYSINVFDAVIKTLPYEYIPFSTDDHNSAGSHDDLVYQAYLGDFDTVVGVVTIVANRSRYVRFALSYTESGVSMVVPIKDDKSKILWLFLKPFTWELWLASFCSFTFISLLIWFLERRTNEDLRGTPRYQVGIIFWFSFSTMVFAQKEKVTSNLARFILGAWFLVVLILTQTYTASLTSMLTVQQLKPTITDINELIRNNENGVVLEINHRNSKTTTSSISKSHIKSIIPTTKKTSPPNGWVIPTNRRMLGIGIPVQESYPEFVHVTWNSDNLTEVRGYLIDVFDALMKTVPSGVSYWTKENGAVVEINRRNSNATKSSISKSHVGSIIWTANKASPPKRRVIPTDRRKLRIGVPVQDSYSDFVHVTWDSNNLIKVRGYCIDVFDAVMKTLPYDVPYEYIPFATADRKSAGSHDDLVYQVYLGNFDAVVGGITIVANRSQYVDFTLPYTESGISMVVPIKDDKSKSLWLFLKPFTWELWLTSFCSFIFIGLLIWFLERHTNEDLRDIPWHQVGVIFWFSFSTMVLAQKDKVKNDLARFVLGTWFLVVLILMQTYIASLTSMLTVQQLKPTITDINELIRNNENVGYQKDSFVFGLLKSMKFHESKLVAYNSLEEIDELFSKGSKNGGIAAAFDEIPYVKLILSKYCSKYTMAGPTYKTGGFAFVFPRGSVLVPDISRAILNVTESERIREIEKTWLGDETKCPDSSALVSSNSIDLGSFGGLFLIVGVVAVLALIIYVIKHLQENWHVFDQSNPASTIWSKTMELFQRFNNRELGSHTFKNEQRERESGFAEQVTESCNEYCESSTSTFSLSSPHSNGTESPTFSIPDSPQRNSADFQVEEENQLTEQQGESSKVIKKEVELANANQNKKLTSVSVDLSCKIH